MNSYLHGRSMLRFKSFVVFAATTHLCSCRQKPCMMHKQMNLSLFPIILWTKPSGNPPGYVPDQVPPRVLDGI